MTCYSDSDRHLFFTGIASARSPLPLPQFTIDEQEELR